MKVVSTEALTRALGLIKTELGKKEPNITKKTGFNLDKTDTVQNNPSVLFTTKGAFDLKTELVNSINAKMDKAGGTFTGNVYFDTANERRIQGSNEVGFYFNNTSGGTVGIYDWIKNKGVLSYNTTSQELGFGVPLRASSFIGALTGKSSTSGTADVAVKLQTPRTITIGNKNTSFDGSSNISYSLADVGAASRSSTSGCAAAAYITNNSSSTVGSKIRLPFKTNEGKMVAFTIRIYQTYMFYDVVFSGYLYSSPNNWYLPKATMACGDGPITVKMGRDDDGYAYVWVPKGDYKGIGVINVVGGYSNADWNSGWQIVETDSCPNVALEKIVYPPYSGNNKPTSADLGFFPSSGGTINGNTGVTGNLTVSGTINGSKTYNAVWNDYAEYFPKKIGYKTEPGDIIALSKNDTTEKYELATNDHVLAIGVHSDQYGHLIGGEKPPEDSDISFEEWNKDKYIPVGLAGRVPVKFIGIARKGMKVVPSDIPGVGKEYGANDRYDNIIGYIVEDNDEEGIRRVKIKIGK